MHYKKFIGYVDSLNIKRKGFNGINIPCLQLTLNNLNIPQWMMKNELVNITGKLIDNLEQEKNNKSNSQSRLSKMRFYVENSLSTVYNMFKVLYTSILVDNYSRGVFGFNRELFNSLDYMAVISELNRLFMLMNDANNGFRENVRSSNGAPESLINLVGAYQRWMEDEIYRAAVTGFLQALAAAGITKYTYRTSGGANICEDCMDLDGKEFEVSEAEEGANLPPMHPNCRCRIGVESGEFDETAYWIAVWENDEKLRNALQNGITGMDEYYKNILLMYLPMKLSSRRLFSLLADRLQKFKDLGEAAIQSLLSLFNLIFLTRNVITEHYSHNLNLELKPKSLNENGFIVEQNELGEWKYGANNSDYNGCGWIAIYNALIALDWDLWDPHPARIINWLEEQPLFKGPILAGNFGTYPWSVGEFFESLGYKVDYSVVDGYSYLINNSMIDGYVYIPDDITFLVPIDVHENAENAAANIIFYQRKDLTAHYVTSIGTGERNEDGDEIYTFYNDDPPKTPEAKRTGIITATLEEFLEIQEPFWEIIISISNKAE